MSNRKTSIYVFFILFLAIIAGLFCYPNVYNKKIDSINEKYNLSIWHFPETDFKLGLDLKGGIHLEYEADLSQIGDNEKGDVMEGLRDIIERRVNIYGVAEPVIQIYGSDRLAVDLPGVESIESAIEWIGTTPLLEFAEEKSEEEIELINQKREELSGLTVEEMQNVENWYLAFESPYKKTDLTGRYLDKASLSFNETTFAPVIELQFDEEGKKLFEEITERNVGKTLAIYLDGESIIEVSGGDMLLELMKK